jgi:hypothetical protein
MSHSTPLTFNPFSSAAMAVQSQPPRWAVRMVSLGICAMVGMTLVFACFARMDIVVSAQGKVIPSGKSKVVQSLEPGVVRSIAVHDGQSVKAGDVLLELEPTATACSASCGKARPTRCARPRCWQATPLLQRPRACPPRLPPTSRPCCKARLPSNAPSWLR